MESQPHDAEFRNNPENFHPCIAFLFLKIVLISAKNTDPDVQICFTGF